MPVPIFRGRCKNGKLTIASRERFDEFLRSLDGDVELLLRRHIPKRSLNANRYYRGIVLPIFAEHCGYTVGELHRTLKAEILCDRSTADLNRAEFADFVDQTRRLAAEMDCFVPDPVAVEPDGPWLRDKRASRQKIPRLSAEPALTCGR